MTTATLTESGARFLQAWEAFTPLPDDCPDAIPYYRNWAGLRAVVGAEDLARFHGGIHNAMFWARDHTWASIRRAIQKAAEGAEPPPEPERRVPWHLSEPAELTEELLHKHASEIFKRDFKRAFPRKRLNTKFARKKWIEVRGHARELARREHEAALAVYERERMKFDKMNAIARCEWLGRVRAIAEFENFARSLPE